MADIQVPLRSDAPLQLGMAPASFDAYKALMVQQETNLCCKHCCCQPNVHYRMSTDVENWEYGTDIPAMWYISEDAPFCGRCCSCLYPGAKSTVWTVHQGDNANGQPVLTHEKGVTCSHCPAACCTEGIEVCRVPWCCCLPYLETKSAEGVVLGTSRYVCDMFSCCVPKFDVFNAENEHVLRVRADTCCFGCCVSCRPQGQRAGTRGRFRVPYLIRQPQEPHEPVGNAAIANLWPGLVAQIWTKRETLRVTFPETTQGQDAHALNSTLIGTTLLLNTLLFDHE